MITATSGAGTSSRALATWTSSAEDSAPMTATLVSRTGRPLSAETPLAMIAPTVCHGVVGAHPGRRASPRTTSSIGSPGPAPYRALSSGAPSNGRPTIRRAIVASTLSRP